MREQVTEYDEQEEEDQINGINRIVADVALCRGMVPNIDFYSTLLKTFEGCLARLELAGSAFSSSSSLRSGMLARTGADIDHYYSPMDKTGQMVGPTIGKPQPKPSFPPAAHILRTLSNSPAVHSHFEGNGINTMHR